MSDQKLHTGQPDTAALQQAAAALQASEQRLRLILDNLPAPCAIYDADKRYLYVNRQLTQMLNLPAERILGQRDEDLLPPQVTNIYIPLLARTIETRQPQQAEIVFRAPAGALHFIAHYVPLLDAQGELREVIGISYDISRQKRIEESLRRRDDEVRSLAENVPDVVARLDRDGRHLYVNRQIESIAGLAAESFLGRTDSELNMPAELVAKWEQMRQTVLETGQPLQSEFACPSPEGMRYFEARFIPEVGADGAVATVLTLTRDISREKLVQMKLAASEERLRQAFEAAPIGIVLVTPEEIFLQANNAFCCMLGYAENELIGLSVAQITHPDDLALTRAAMQDLFTLQRPTEMAEKRYLAKDGSIVWGRFTGTAILDADGQPRYGLGMVENITESRAAAQELARYREHLEELVRSRTRALEASQQTLRSAERLASLGTLASGIVHEINNPLGTILLAAEAAQSAQLAGDQETLLRCLASIQEDAQRCGQIVKNVVSFARHERTDKSPVLLNDSVRRALERVAGYASAHGAKLDWELDDSLGEIMMNATGVEQALVNVLRNAIESRPTGVTVRVTTRKLDNYHEVAISDDGQGISAEVLQHIFDPFFTTRRAIGGTGLGLSLVHGTVTDHRGVMRVDSTPGQGTTLTIQLPCGGEEDASGPPAAPLS